MCTSMHSEYLQTQQPFFTVCQFNFISGFTTLKQICHCPAGNGVAEIIEDPTTVKFGWANSNLEI